MCVYSSVCVCVCVFARGEVLPLRLLGTRVLGLEISTQPWNNFIGLMWPEMTGIGCHVQK